MTRRLRRPLAALLLFLLPALAAAPRGAVCAHGGDVATASAGSEHRGHSAAHVALPPHTHGAHHAAGAGNADAEPATDHTCPMESGQAGCTTQAPLPAAAAVLLAISALPYSPPAATTALPPSTDAHAIFHPPRA